LLIPIFLYTQKHRITIKKLTSLTIIVLVAPFFLHFINFGFPYLVDNLPFVFIEFPNQIHRIVVFGVTKIHQVLLDMLKKGFIEGLTTVCIFYCIRVVLLGSFFILDIISNLFITNSLLLEVMSFYAITLFKVVVPFVDKSFIKI